MRSSPAAIAALLLAVTPAWVQAQAPPGRETIERVLAVVDERPLLLSDVRTLAAVRALDPKAALEAAIDERLMHAEASRLTQAEVRPEDERSALALLLERAPLLRQRVGEAELRRLLRRQIAILKYVEFRFRPQLRVSDEQVRAAWAAEAAGPAFEDAQEAIRVRLERQALDARVEAWVAELRARAVVRYVGG
jgi:hypothetical protein